MACTSPRVRTVGKRLVVLALLGHEVTTTAERRRAMRRYAAFVAEGKGVRLWDAALRQQIYLGDEAFAQRMQAGLEPAKRNAGEIPRAQRSTRATTVAQYVRAARSRDEGIARAHREGGHSLSTIARELGLSVSRVSYRGWSSKIRQKQGLTR